MVLLGALALVSCGKRGDPLPPLRRTPQPVSGLRVSQHGDRLEITFVAPRGYADQTRLPVLEVELFRADSEGDFDKVAKKDVRRVAPGERVVEDEPLPAIGSKLRFAARAIAKGRPSARTALISITIASPPEVPTGLVVRSAEKGVALEWVPPAVMPVEPSPSPSPSPSPTEAESPSPAPEPSASPGASPASPFAAPSPSSSPASPPSPPAGSKAAAPQAPAPTAAGSPGAQPSPSATPSPSSSPAPAASHPLRPNEPSASPQKDVEASPSPPGGPESPPSSAPPGEVTATPSPGASPSPSPSPSPTPKPRTTGFFTYRRAQLGSYERPLQSAPIAESTFVDMTAVRGEELCYVVRTVASTDPLIESADSEESCLSVEDVSAPAAPIGVAAQARPDGIEISWSPSPEPDVARYRIYRIAAQAPRARIAEVPVGEQLYVDTSAPVGVAQRYTVTAVDKAGNESLRSAAASATRR